MKQTAILATLFLVLLTSCGLPPEYIVRDEMYPRAAGYSTRSEDLYTLFRISDEEKLAGYLISIKESHGIIFLKVTPNAILETALLYQEGEGDAKKFPIYQSDWNQPLRQAAERPNLRPALTHFLTNHYLADQQPQKGGALSIF
jgi:hypothetical protein